MFWSDWTLGQRNRFYSIGVFECLAGGGGEEEEEEGEGMGRGGGMLLGEHIH